MSVAASPTARWVDPHSGRDLDADRPWSLTDGATRWPVVAGIPYLRVGRDDLVRATLEALDAGDERTALALLLGDQDDYARTPPPDLLARLDLVDVVDRDELTLRDAMERLHFGPVADYFAYRWSSPTYLSGLSLLNRYAWRSDRVVEVACGIGPYLRDLAGRGVECLGTDVVFAKLWLARRFVVPTTVALVCGDVAALPIAPSAPTTVFCHDAFYFLRDKPGVIAAFERMAGEGGTILIGHAHNRDFDHGGVSGEPWTPDEYATLIRGGHLHDDAELAVEGWSGRAAPLRSSADLSARRVEAIAITSGTTEIGSEHRIGLHRVRPGASLRLNPLLQASGDGYAVAWPSPRFAAEYAATSPYLVGEPTVDPSTLDRAARGEVDAAVARLARRRILLDLPDRW